MKEEKIYVIKDGEIKEKVVGEEENLNEKKYKEIMDSEEMQVRREKDFLEITFQVNYRSPFLEEYSLKIYSTAKEKEIKRSYRSTEDEWKWYLSDGKYIVALIKVDKFGKHYCDVYAILVDVAKGSVIRKELPSIPTYVEVCEECNKEKKIESIDEGAIKKTPEGNRYKEKIVEVDGELKKMKLYEIKFKMINAARGKIGVDYKMWSKRRNKLILPYETKDGIRRWYLLPGRYILKKFNYNRELFKEIITIYELIINTDGTHYLKEIEKIDNSLK